jgi:hypothetical protein
VRHSTAADATQSNREGPMFSIPLLNKRKIQAQLSSLAQEIATASRQAVRLFVADRCIGMSQNELRGYVRARAAGPVRERAMQRSRDFAGLSPREVKAVTQLATDRVVHLVVNEPSCVEIPLQTYRKAA